MRLLSLKSIVIFIDIGDLGLELLGIDWNQILWYRPTTSYLLQHINIMDFKAAVINIL